jgi:hypothetical protein
MNRPAILFFVLSPVFLCPVPAICEPGGAPATEQKTGGSFHFDYHTVVDAIAILGTIVAVAGYVDLRNAMKEQKPLIDIVKRNIKKDVTEETLKGLTDELKAMQEQTTKIIPQLARRAALEEQAEGLKTIIGRTYAELTTVEEELGPGGSTGLHPELERAIADRILPSYRKHQRSERDRERITILAAAVVVSGTLLPDPLSIFVQVPLGIWLVTIVLRLSSRSAMDEDQRRRVQIAFRIVFGIVISAWLGFAATLLFAGGVTTLGHIIAWALVALASMLLLSTRWIDGKVKYMIQKTAFDN